MQNIETWQANTPLTIKKFRSHGNSLFSCSPHPLDFNMLVFLSLKMLNKDTNSR